MNSIVDHSDIFTSADSLVSYMELHAETPRALISVKHLALLGYLADAEILLRKKDIEKPKQFVSLHANGYRNLIKIARERIQRKEIPDDWLDGFNALMESPV